MIKERYLEKVYRGELVKLFIGEADEKDIQTLRICVPDTILELWQQELRVGYFSKDKGFVKLLVFAKSLGIFSLTGDICGEPMWNDNELIVSVKELVRKEEPIAADYKGHTVHYEAQHSANKEYIKGKFFISTGFLASIGITENIDNLSFAKNNNVSLILDVLLDLFDLPYMVIDSEMKNLSINVTMIDNSKVLNFIQQ